ncbi:hypothetical protein FB45DRAFT_1149661 [Roridomyces roridus]|uniref:Uncharacterized protein n=1 Tax=Roridomyces roridus TaxID=1738132 RepID=A0AAD7AYZ5_9AGAR|nr:hypothetical protein FB45DRAFT_1149661 [Roridomyces roridus]
MGQQKTGKRPGRPSGFQGEKLKFLKSFEADFHTPDRGPFYDDVTKKFISRYGIDLPFTWHDAVSGGTLLVTQNVDGDIEDWKPVDKREGLTGDALEDEKKHYREVLAELRAKFGNWYRHKYTGKRLHRSAISSILKTMQHLGAGGVPRRKAYAKHYSEKYYASRIKKGFDKEWEAAKTTLGDNMRVCQTYAQKCWDAEPEDFKAALIAEVDTEHAEKVKKFREKNDMVEHTAEEYHEAYSTFDGVGIPLADALAERLGMAIIILAVGHVGKQNGEVRLRTVFSETSGYETNKTWGKAELKAFTAMENNITSYGRKLFSKETCRKRAIKKDTDSTIQDAPTTTTTPTMTATSSKTGSSSAPAAPSTSSTAPPVTTTVPTPPDLDKLIAMTTDITLAADEWPDVRPVAQNSWPSELKSAWEYIGDKHWGPRWDVLLVLMVEFEKRWAPRADGKPLPNPGKIRPKEIGQWQKEHRRPVDQKLEGGFGARLVEWCATIMPNGQDEALRRRSWKDAGSTVTWEDWAPLRKGGTNGLTMLVRAAAWWGQSIVSQGEGKGLGEGLRSLWADKEFVGFLKDLILGYKEMMEENPADEDDSEQPQDDEGAKEKEAEAGKGKGKGKKKSAAKKQIEPRQVPTRASKRKRGGDQDTDQPDTEPAAKKVAEGTDRPRPRAAYKGAAPAPEIGEQDSSILDNTPDPTQNTGDTQKTPDGPATPAPPSPVPTPPSDGTEPASVAHGSVNDDPESGVGDALQITPSSSSASLQLCPEKPIPETSPTAGDSGPTPPPPDDDIEMDGGHDNPLFEPFEDAEDDFAGMTDEERRLVQEEMDMHQKDLAQEMEQAGEENGEDDFLIGHWA